MGALKGSITVRRYVVKGDIPREKGPLTKGIRAHAFVPIDPRGDVVRSHGWAWIEDPDVLDLDSDRIYSGEAVALSMRVDTLKPPAAAVKKLVQEGVRALGRKPTKDEKDALRLEAIRKLRARLLPASRAYDLVWLIDSRRVLFWSLAKKTNELMADLFWKSFKLELIADGPGLLARQAVPATVPLAPTPELVTGFAGFPGRVTASAEDADA